MPPVKIGIQTQFDPAGTAAAKVAIGQVGAEASKADKQLLSYAATTARLQQSAGNLAGAEKTLASALSQVDQTTKQALASATQLQNVQNRISGQTQSLSGLFKGLGDSIKGMGGEMGGAAGYAQQLGASAGAALSGIIGPAAIATTALGALKGAFDLAQASAKIDATRASFDHLAASVGTTGDVMLAKMRAAAAGTVSDAALIQSANSGLLLTSGRIANDLPRILEVARAAAQATGDDVGFVFNSLVTGIARGSPKVIDNAKITLDASAAFETYAKSIGKSTDALTAADQQQATLNAVLLAGNDLIKNTGGAADGNAAAFARAGVALENTKNAAGSLLADGFAPLANQFSDMIDGIGQLTSGLQQMGGTLDALATGTYGFTAATGAASGGAWDLTGAVIRTATAINDGTAATDTATAALRAHAAEYAAVTAVTTQSVQISMVDATAKQEVALKTQLLTAETNAATNAFMLLHPNITAGGVAALVMAGKIDPLLAQLIQARLRAIDATNAMIAFNNQANIKAVGATIAANRTAGRMGRGDSSDAAEGAVAAKTRADAIKAAQDARTLAVGTKNQKVALLQDAYNAAVRLHGAESADAINAQTKLIQAQSAKEKGAGAAKVSAAEKAANKLTSIEESAGTKIAKIVADRDAKLLALDQKYAEESAAAFRKLQTNIANTQGNRRVSNEVNDLDLIGKHTPDEARKLNDRERAEADARRRSEANAEEARKKAEAGEAESADKIYQIREDQNQKQQDLDEAYYAKQAELGKNPELQAALKQQYDEATKAIQEQSDREVTQENDLAELKKAQREKEHDDIILAATDAANVAIGQAERMADGIIKASGTAKAQASTNLKAIGDAVNAIPSNKTITITVKQEGSTSGAAGTSGGTKSAGGGTFMTHGPTTLTVGDNPGGMELVHVEPISGVGQTTVGGGMTKLAGGGTVLVDAGGGYTTPVAQGGKPAKNAGTAKTNADRAAAALKQQIEEQRATVALLTDLLKLRSDLEAAVNDQPFNVGLIRQLAIKGALFLQIVQAQVVPITKKQGEAFKLYVDAAKDAISVIKEVADLRHSLQDNINDQPFNIGLIKGLANRAALFLGIVQSQLVPTTQFQADQLSRYRDAEQNATSILKDVADLRHALQESVNDQPFNLELITQFAADAARVTTIMRGKIVPTSKEQAEQAGLYRDAEGSGIDILKSTINLGKDLRELAPPMQESDIVRLADEGVRITAIMRSRVVPIAKEEADAFGLYRDVVGAGADTLKSVLDVGSKLFEGYVSPSDAQISVLARDAERVARAFGTAAATYKTDALDQAKLYADTVGATFGVIKDGALAFAALNSGDFILNPQALDQFVQGSDMALGAIARLGASAAKIPPANIAALQATTTALGGQAEALIKLAAVPFGDIQPAAAGLAQQSATLSGGGGGTVFNNTFNLAGPDAKVLAQQVIQIMDTQVRMRR